MDHPKVSIITVVFNSASTLQDCIDSVAGQDYPNREHLLIDGGSSDGTIDVIRANEGRIAAWISEPDHGIYDALNKGIRMATGDVIGILNADDAYVGFDVLSTVMRAIHEGQLDSVYGDVDYVDAKRLDRVVRAWRSGPFEKGMFFRGRFPAHPSFFVRKAVYERLGGFDVNLRLAADFELMLRFLERWGISTRYIPRSLVRMRMGGASNRSLKNIIRSVSECKKAFPHNGFRTPLWFVPGTLWFRLGHLWGKGRDARPAETAGNGGEQGGST